MTGYESACECNTCAEFLESKKIPDLEALGNKIARLVGSPVRIEWDLISSTPRGYVKLEYAQANILLEMIGNRG